MPKLKHSLPPAPPIPPATPSGFDRFNSGEFVAVIYQMQPAANLVVGDIGAVRCIAGQYESQRKRDKRVKAFPSLALAIAWLIQTFDKPDIILPNGSNLND